MRSPAPNKIGMSVAVQIDHLAVNPSIKPFFFPINKLVSMREKGKY